MFPTEYLVVALGGSTGDRSDCIELCIFVARPNIDHDGRVQGSQGSGQQVKRAQIPVPAHITIAQQYCRWDTLTNKQSDEPLHRTQTLKRNSKRR